MRDTGGSGNSAVAQKQDFESELYSRLGLTATATTQEVETAYEQCVGFLEGAPSELKQWSKSQLEAVNEAYALLSDPTIDLGALAAEWSSGSGHDEVKKAQPQASGKTAVTSMAGETKTRRKLPGTRKVWLILALLVAVPVVGVVVYRSGNSAVPPISGAAKDSATGSTSNSTTAASGQKSVDKKKVGALMQKITANPKDGKSYQELGDIYFQAADYKNAVVFERKAMAIDPKNTTAELGLGASLFNLGDAKGAEKAWIDVTRLDPSLAEAHYDLGFLYLGQDPPNIAKVKQEWNLVVKLDPKSEIAKTVASHLKSLDNPSPAPATSPAPSAGAKQ